MANFHRHVKSMYVLCFFCGFQVVHVSLAASYNTPFKTPDRLTVVSAL